MYLIMDKFSDHFQQFLDPEQMTPYDIISIVHMASFLRDPSKGFSYFVNEFASRVYFLIFEVNYPRVPQHFQMYFHPHTKNQIGDCFLYHDYTVIRIYGYEEQPYRLLTFLTPKFFSLEVLRQRLHSDELHFSSKKQTSSFKVPITVGPFTIRNKVAIELIDDIMACFRVIPDEVCQYDPLQLISKKKKKQRRGNYEYHGTPEMMELENKLTLHTDPDREIEMMDLITTPNPSADPKGKRKMSLIPFPEVTSTIPSPKKLKVFKDPFL